MTFRLMRLRALLQNYFNPLPDKENEQETIRTVSEGVVFRSANLWVLMFAILIASLGLNVNSTAVIIGAMLISPLMGPILGMGLAAGIDDFDLMRRALKNYAVATLISILTATLYFLLSPLSEAQSELLARTSPTLYDVLIALFGGAAGIMAVATRAKGNVVTGVAIATALMPPLCTAGYGLATGNLQYFGGALLLFFINTVFIALATFAGVRILKFERLPIDNPKAATRARHSMIALVLLTLIPAAWITVGIVGESIMRTRIDRFLKEELVQSGTQIIRHEVDEDNHTLHVVSVGREIPAQQVQNAQARLEKYHLSGYSLNVIQGMQSDSLLQLSDRLNAVLAQRDNSGQRLLEQSQTIHALEARLEAYEQLEALAPDVLGEVRLLFPGVTSLLMARAVEARADSLGEAQYVVAVVQMADTVDVAPDEAILTAWLQRRVHADSVRLILP